MPRLISGREEFSKIVTEIREQGYATIRIGTSSELLNFSADLGTIVAMRQGGPLVQELRPTEIGAGSANSLSARHGKASFPLHTDTAFWQVPANLILLRSAGKAGGSTLVHDYSWVKDDPTLVRRMEDSIFSVSSGRRSFLASAFDRTTGILRIDRDCMRPANASARDLFDLLETSCPVAAKTEVEWTDGLGLVIDNWRMVHGRSDCTGLGTEGRMLERTLVINTP